MNYAELSTASSKLNWKTDTILFDPTPVPQNSWLCVNELIERELFSSIFLDGLSLNLYPIMIRKLDFIGSKRLLQTMPYLLLSDSWAQRVRRQSLALAERCHYYFASSSANCSIKQWQKKIINYSEKQNRIPFPIFRLVPGWEQLFKKGDSIAFQSARGENFWLPLRVSENLSYFLGIIAGDGHLTEHNVIIVDFSKEHIEMLRRLSSELFGIEGTISGENKIWLLFLNNKWLVRLVNFLTDQPITGKKYDRLREPLLLRKSCHWRFAYWRGVLDSDGSFKDRISFSTSSPSFREAFCKFLEEYQIHYCSYENRGALGRGYTIYIRPQSKIKFGSLIGSWHPVKKKELQGFLHKKCRKPAVKGDFFDSVRRTKKSFVFTGFKETTIISVSNKDYFNFSLLPHLGVLNCSSFIKNLRKERGLTQEHFAKLVSERKDKLASYEYSSDVPIVFLERVLQLLPKKEGASLMPFLQENNLRIFRSRKTTSQLDLQPNSKLEEIMKGLELRRNYLLISREIEGKRENIKERICNHFQIKKPKGNKICNSVLYKFTTTFMKI